MATYFLRISQASPSMMQDVMEIRSIDYADAVRQAQDKWREVRRDVCLYGNRHDYVWPYHRIDDLGHAVDTNTNSGVPNYAKLAG